MLFGLYPNHTRDAPPRLLTVKAKLYDGSEIIAEVEDALLVFKTGLGDSRILLRNIKSIENIANVVTLRRLLRANKFKIHCMDGCKLVGIPVAPTALRLHRNGTPHAHGTIHLWKIDSLEVLTREQE